MNIHNKKELGNEGEKIAIRYLEKIGYEILKRNFYCKQGEIDIIAKYENKIIFIEVKTRTSINFGRPVDAVNSIKEKHMYNAAKYYLYKKYMLDEEIRFDVIEVLVENGKFNVNHIKEII